MAILFSLLPVLILLLGIGLLHETPGVLLLRIPRLGIILLGIILHRRIATGIIGLLIVLEALLRLLNSLLGLDRLITHLTGLGRKILQHLRHADSIILNNALVLAFAESQDCRKHIVQEVKTDSEVIILTEGTGILEIRIMPATAFAPATTTPIMMETIEPSTG